VGRGRATRWNVSTASKNCAAVVLARMSDHRRSHRGDVVVGRPLERRLGQPELEVQPGFEQIQGMGWTAETRDPARLRGPAEVRWHSDAAARSRPDSHQVAITQDAQRLVHHRRADAEPVHELGSAAKVSPDL
jgi:hypothetical protein